MSELQIFSLIFSVQLIGLLFGLGSGLILRMLRRWIN